MSGSREEILGRIRHAAGERPRSAASEYGTIPRAYRSRGTLGGPARLALFIQRLEDYQVRVYRCTSGAIAPAVGEALAAHNKRHLVVPRDLEREWLPAGLAFAPDLGLSCEDLDLSDGVVTGCTLGIALTGSLVLCHGRGEGRRALTLVPDYHLCVVHADQVVETVPEAFQRLKELGPRMVTTIAGPSATADIEMTRIRGVHGPRTLDVILVAAD